MRTHFILIMAAILLIMDSCTQSNDKRLDSINASLCKNPATSKEMQDLLDSIDSGTLSENDKVYKDLLTIKIRDLNFEQHPSDSLIKRVLNYITTHKDVTYYCEALYYGGRVYHNLGDYPTALGYYQQALSDIQTCQDSAIMTGKIYAQMGGLLDRMRLYKEAIPIYEEVVRRDINMNDSLNEVNDMIYLGNVLLRDGEILRGKAYLKKAVCRSRYMSGAIRSKSMAYLGRAYLKLNQIDSALSCIRMSLDSLDSYTRRAALSSAIEIYSRAGIKDSALFYAKELLKEPVKKYRLDAYRILLSEDFKEYVPEDSLRRYAAEYYSVIDKGYDSNQAELVLQQRNMYNYDMHENARKDLEIENQHLLNERLWLSIVLLLGVITLIYMRYRDKKQKLQLQISLYNIRTLGYSLKKKPLLLQGGREEPQTEKTSRKIMLEELKEYVRIIAEESGPVALSPTIIASAVYAEIKERINLKHAIEKESEIWKNLDEIIHEESPEFRSRLNLLTGGKITEAEYRTACLIKIQIPPVKIGILFQRNKTTIGSRRESIGKKIYGEKIGVELVDKIIRKL